VSRWRTAHTAPWAWRTRAASRIDESADTERATLVVILIDSETGIVRAMIVRCAVIVGNVIVGSEVP
jgi:hypothetical protein